MLDAGCVRPTEPDLARFDAIGRVAVLLESGRRGWAAVRYVTGLERATSSRLSVVAIVPQAPRTRCCGPSPDAFNCAVRDDLAEQVDRATRLLDRHGLTAAGVLLVEGEDPSLEAWVLRERVRELWLPARGMLWRKPRHSAARRLAGTAVAVSVIAPRSSPSFI